MILTCPKCASRFTLPADMLAGGGRKVKCSSCGEVWFQEPEEQGGESGEEAVAPAPEDNEPQEQALPEITDDTVVEDQSETEDGLPEIPDIAAMSDEHEAPEGEGVAEEEPSDFASMLAAAEGAEPDEEAGIGDADDPLPGPPEGVEEEDDLTRAVQDDDEEHEKPAMAKPKLFGFAMAGVVFLLILAVFLVLHGPLSQGWPASQSVYRWFGYEMNVPGERLIFDGIKVETTTSGFGGRVVTVKGRVMNLSREDQDVPMIEAELRRESGEVILTWLITPPARHLEAESEMEFESRQETSEAGAEVKLRFILNAEGAEEDHSKTVSEDGDNTPAH